MLKKLIASVVGATMLLVPGLEANARTPWILLEDNGSARQWIANLKTVAGEPHDRVYDHRYISQRDDDTSHRYTDCLTGQTWFWVEAGETWVLLDDYLPGTFGETEFNYVCPGY